MDLHKDVTAAKLTDDLAVDILSRLEYKDFCRCKCAYKAWSALSSDPDYGKKLPNKVTTGLLYQCRNKSAMLLVSLFRQIGEIDGILADVPHYEHLEFLDCCNGLVLCKYRSSYTTPGICRFVVCNPATRQWRIIPDTHHITDDPRYVTMLAFDPSWSPQFYIFNFRLEHDHGLLLGTSKHERLPPEASHRGNFTNGCFGKSSGILHYALSHESCRSIVVWTLDDYAHNLGTWTVKCHLNMADAFGKGEFVHYDGSGQGGNDKWFSDCYCRMVDLDLERELVFLHDQKAQKLLSYSISTGKINVVQDTFKWYQYSVYVPCYSELAAQEPSAE